MSPRDRLTLGDRAQLLEAHHKGWSCLRESFWKGEVWVQQDLAFASQRSLWLPRKAGEQCPRVWRLQRAAWVQREHEGGHRECLALTHQLAKGLTEAGVSVAEGTQHRAHSVQSELAWGHVGLKLPAEH